MSNTGKFILKSLDGVISSNLLVGTAYLTNRIQTIYKQYGEDDKLSVLSELNKTHLLHIYSEFKQMTPIANEYTRLQSRSGGVSWGGEAAFDLPDIGHFWSDMVLNLAVGEIGKKGADPYGGAPLYNYCKLPGIRIIEEVNLTIDGNPIDKYTSDDVIMMYNFETPTHKRSALERCLGQEQPKVGYITYSDYSLREKRFIMNGPQTPRPYQPVLDMWIPTKFWFNEGIENALCASSVPYGQRFIKFKLTDYANVIKKTDVDGNVLPLEVSEIPSIVKCSLYVNNIILDPAVYDLFLDKATFRLARVFNSMNVALTTPNGRVWINKFKYPTEQMYFGFRPMENRKTVEHWHKFKKIDRNPIPIPIAKFAGGTTPNLLRESIYYWNENQLINQLTFTIGGFKLYENMVPSFFNSYLPSKKSMIVAPNDIGMFYIPFNQRPLDGTLSGFIDFSRIREFYIEYASDFISTETESELILSSRSINFLIISKTMALKFAT